MYSIIMGLLGTNIGLRITGNPYSMSFGIGFIALTGIVVNDAIVFIDRANSNMRRWMSRSDAVIETGKSRLQPIILTTLTTVVWLSSVARQDEFFAGLAYTIMFGLATASVMTLFVIPALYEDTAKIIHNIKRSLVAGAVFMWAPIGAILAIYVIALMFNVGFITDNIGSGIWRIIFVGYLIAYIVYAIQESYDQRTQHHWKDYRSASSPRWWRLHWAEILQSKDLVINGEVYLSRQYWEVLSIHDCEYYSYLSSLV
jgi:hypothetical protein